MQTPRTEERREQCTSMDANGAPRRRPTVMRRTILSIDAIEDGKAKAEPGELQRLRERNRVVSARMRELEDRSEALETRIEAKLRTMVERAIRDGRARPMR